MQSASDAGALAHSLFQAKLQNAPRDGPAKESGDQNRGDRRDRHDEKNPALNIFHVRDGAWELLIEFADFTRYSFRTAGEYTTLQDELTNIERYVRLEKARFGARLNIKLQIAPEVLSVVLPFLALQPLVENAVRHGLGSKPSGGTITITAENAGNECVIIVEDDGIGMDPARLHEDLADAHQSGAHVGLGNVDDRMRSTFGDDFGLVVDTAPGQGMKITLRVPKFRAGIRV